MWAQTSKRQLIVSGCLLLTLFGSAQEPEPEDPIVGLLDEGKVYRTVNERPISGREIGDILFEQHWTKEKEHFLHYHLVKEELERRELVVTPGELEDSYREFAREYAKAQRMPDPGSFTIEDLAAAQKVPVSYLRRENFPFVGLKKILVLDGALKPDASMTDQKTREVMNQRLEELASGREVVTDPDKLKPGEALRVGGRVYTLTEARAFVLDSMGHLRQSVLEQALRILTLQYAVEDSLGEAGVDGLAGLTRQDLIFHRSYLISWLARNQNMPLSQGRDMYKTQLAMQGISPESVLGQRDFQIDAALTWLAKRDLTESDLKRVWTEQAEKYQLKEKRFAHIFLEVRAPDGTPYTPDFRVGGAHPKVNRMAEIIRDERFADAKRTILSWEGLVRTDWNAAVLRFSRHADKTKAENGQLGYIGRVGEHTQMPGYDQELFKQAMALKPGEISKEPLRSAFGWHWVRCLEDGDTNFDEVKRVIYLDLIHERKAELTKALMDKAGIQL
jgi:hypothetical protein